MRNIWGPKLVGVINSQNKAYLFGEEVYCLGAEKVSQVSKLRGASIKYCYGDEVADWNKEVFDMLKSRLDKPYSCFDGALNPQNPTHWLKEFLDSDADIYCQEYTIFDNPFLDKNFVKQLCLEYEGTVFYDRYILGKWKMAEGLIYDMFDYRKHVVDEEETVFTSDTYYVSCDYGTQNATVFLLWRQDVNGRWICIDEYYYSGRENQKQKTNHEYAVDMEKFLDGRYPMSIVVDPSAASFILELENMGYVVAKADNNVVEGIRYVASLLNQEKIGFFKKCKNLIKEFDNYIWDAKAAAHGEDKPIKENDHAMDGIRYYCFTIIKNMFNISNLT